jgi:hypothetical protein
MWRCPTCKSKDHLEVVVETWARLIQPDSEPEAYSTDETDASMGGDMEWSSNSVMACVNGECANSYDTHIAEYFDVGEEEDDAQEDSDDVDEEDD